jgi:hypothetical protein
MVTVELFLVGLLLPAVGSFLGSQLGASWWTSVFTNPIGPSKVGTGVIGASASAGLWMVWQLLPMSNMILDITSAILFGAFIDKLVLFIAWGGRLLRVVLPFGLILWASQSGGQAGEVHVRNFTGTNVIVATIGSFQPGEAWIKVDDGTYSVTDVLGVHSVSLVGDCDLWDGDSGPSVTGSHGRAAFVAWGFGFYGVLWASALCVRVCLVSMRLARTGGFHTTTLED